MCREGAVPEYGVRDESVESFTIAGRPNSQQGTGQLLIHGNRVCRADGTCSAECRSMVTKRQSKLTEPSSLAANWTDFK